MCGPGRSSKDRLHIPVVKGMGFEARLPGFKSQPYH